MSADRWAPQRIAPVERRHADLLLAVGVLAAIVGAVLPLLRVIDRGPWLVGAVGLAAAVLATGVVARRLRLPGVAVALLEVAVWALALTALFARSTAVMWMIPTPDTFGLVPVLVSAAVDQIVMGAAPLEPATPLAFLLVAAVGLVALAIDHVVLTARMPLLAAVGLVAVSLIPSIAVPGDIDLASFVLLAASILFLLRVDTRARQAAPEPSGRPSRPRTGASATAVAVGAVAVVVALVAAPLLPSPAARAGAGGIGAGSTIDPTLELGDDLRKPRETEVLSVRSTAPGAPYLRAVTLSRFDGAVWEPDDGRVLPLEGEDGGLPDLAVDEDVSVAEYRTTVEVVDLNSPWLPVPYPAVSVTGLDGEWGALPENRTMVTRSSSTQGQVYEVTSRVPRPTLEQIRSREAGGDVPEETLILPSDIPGSIAATAAEVTASAETDFDALQTLQAWFRSPQFSYSLEAPVQDGFDGSGAGAVAQFLEVREGYCVHFASAFALMARTLGMPARIVVGYLPGVNTTTSTQGEPIYSVSSSQLHAWPEVHFAGIGWIPFEPTNSLGVPTSFASAASPRSGDAGARAPQDATQPSGAPSPTASAGGRPQDDIDAGAVGPSGATAWNPWPAVGVALAVLAVLTAPGVLGELRRRRRAAAARGGDAASAWLAVQELAIDLGIPVSGSDSPRAFGARLIDVHGAPSEAMTRLVSAIEHASYADDAARTPGLDGPVAGVRAVLLRGSSPSRRLMAVLAPRSLVIRPGSAYAHPPGLAPAH